MASASSCHKCQRRVATNMSVDAVLPWHQEAWEQLLQQQRNNRLAHAYLLSGLPGSGRHQFARALAGRLLCEKPVDDRACGVCRQCLLFDGGNHPDVLDIAPEEGSAAIKIDQIRRISQLVNQTSNQTGAIKIIIIRPAEALGTAAANSLLKNLEEPPGRTLFLLISEPAARMLATIRSRCQPLPLPAASHGQALVWLQAHSAAPEPELSDALQLVPGQPVTALALLEQGIPAWREIVREQLADMELGRVSALELAKYCSAQPPLYAIQLMQDLVAERVRRDIESGDENQGNLRALLVFGRELVKINAQLQSGANPNALMALEHIFLSWQQALAVANGQR